MRPLRISTTVALLGLVAATVIGCGDEDPPPEPPAPTPTATATVAPPTATPGDICIGPRCFIPSPTPSR